MVVRCQFGRTLLITDDELHRQVLGAREYLEQLDVEPLQFPGFRAFEMISGVDVRVGFVFVLMLLVTVIRCRVVLMSSVRLFDQSRDDFDVYHAAARIAVELKKTSAVPERGERSIQCCMVGFG